MEWTKLVPVGMFVAIAISAAGTVGAEEAPEKRVRLFFERFDDGLDNWIHEGAARRACSYNCVLRLDPDTAGETAYAARVVDVPLDVYASVYFWGSNTSGDVDASFRLEFDSGYVGVTVTDGVGENTGITVFNSDGYRKSITSWSTAHRWYQLDFRVTDREIAFMFDRSGAGIGHSGIPTPQDATRVERVSVEAVSWGDVKIPYFDFDHFWFDVFDRDYPLIEIVEPSCACVIIEANEQLVRADASDATSGVERVEFRVDDAIRETRTEPPYEWLWDTEGESAGVHTLEVWVFDRAEHAAFDYQNILLHGLY